MRAMTAIVFRTKKKRLGKITVTAVDYFSPVCADLADPASFLGPGKEAGPFLHFGGCAGQSGGEGPLLFSKKRGWVG